ncbi:hypothetical protein Anapl_13960 [Anas platyrhynchos]|uniref:Uncharacterized protein n=1 Tax=Anas platyrhynchos TaxID=8839 RepID=R0M362_ANAPL|nr:hypothetical protein Anapl_13960 [Anas platyrhynchos]
MAYLIQYWEDNLELCKRTLNNVKTTRNRTEKTWAIARSDLYLDSQESVLEDNKESRCNLELELSCKVEETEVAL